MASKTEIRREIINAARFYVNAEPGTKSVADAWYKMNELLPKLQPILGNDTPLLEIAKYCYNPELDEGDCDRMAEYVCLPDCPNCGIDGSTTYHPDSTEESKVLICMVCGHIGFG